MENALHFLRALDVETHQLALDVGNVVALSERYHLSGHDAVYFHLAKSLNLPLATFDGGLRTACRAHGVKMLHWTA